MYVQHSSNTILIGCPSNAPSLDFWGLTQPKQNIWITNHQHLELWWLWSGMLFHKSTSRSEHDQQMLSPREQSMLQVRECLDKVKICIEKHKNAAQTAKKNIVTWSDYIVTWSDYNMIFGGMLASSTCIKRTPQNNFLRGLHRTSKFKNISISLACKRQLKPKTEKWAAWAIHSRDVDAACTGIVQTPGDFPIPYQDEMVLLGNSSYS